MRTFIFVFLSSLLLAACASPKEQFYTLSPRPVASAVAESRYFAAIQPVVVPEALDRPQLVVHRSASQVEILEQSRWAGSLKNEIQQALVVELSRHGVLDVYGQVPPNAPVYRVALTVNVLTVSQQQSAQWQAAWSLRQADGRRGVLCRASGEGPPAGVAGSGAAEAYRQTVQGMLQFVSSNVQAFAAGGVPPNCVAM
jgi:uncharacterized lipoprotein YmbA